MTDYTLVVLIIFVPQSLKGSIIMTAKVQALDDWIRSDFKAMNTSLEHEYSRSSERQSTIGIGDNIKRELVAEGTSPEKALTCPSESWPRIGMMVRSWKNLGWRVPQHFGSFTICVSASNCVMENPHRASFTAAALSVNCPIPPLALSVCIWSQYISFGMSDNCLA